MKQAVAFSLLLFFTVIACNNASLDETKIPQMNFDSFEPLLQLQNDTTYVINFWATWCKPCIEELPHFEKMNEVYQNSSLNIKLVSLDFPGKTDELVKPFVKKNNYQLEVIHLSDVNANSWIDKVNAEWSGAIPATLIYKKDKRTFIEGKITYNELDSLIKLHL